MHNQVFQYATIEKLPIVKYDDEGNPVQARGKMSIVRGRRKTGEANRGKQQVRVMAGVDYFTTDPECCKTIAEFKRGDLVLMKGNLLHKKVTRVRPCDVCGAMFQKKNQSFLYVSPIHVSIEHTDLSIEESLKKLKTYAEISNICTMVGYVVGNPIDVPKHEKDPCCKIPIVIDRKFFVSSQPLVKSDLLFVHCYGQKNIEAAHRCKVGTEIFIDGALRARQNAKDIPHNCENTVIDDEGNPQPCLGLIKWSSVTIDIVPYSIELLNKWVTDEELEENSNTELNDIKDDLFSEEPEEITMISS